VCVTELFTLFSKLFNIVQVFFKNSILSCHQRLNEVKTYHVMLEYVLYRLVTRLMLRSQIKLTSYDFSDLHITGEFDNRPGTGRFFRNFFCVVTYRTGAGRRLYMKTSADARPGTVRRRTVPGRRCKRSTGHRTVPGRFYTNFHV